jgi:hypothetical protein
MSGPRAGAGASFIPAGPTGFGISFGVGRYGDDASSGNTSQSRSRFSRTGIASSRSHSLTAFPVTPSNSPRQSCVMTSSSRSRRRSAPNERGAGSCAATTASRFASSLTIGSGSGASGSCPESSMSSPRVVDASRGTPSAARSSKNIGLSFSAPIAPRTRFHCRGSGSSCPRSQRSTIARDTPTRFASSCGESR